MSPTIPSGDDEFSRRLKQQLQQTGNAAQQDADDSEDHDSDVDDESRQAEQQAGEQEDEALSGGPVGDGEYIVREGDCLSSIARDSGHFWETIWNDGGNTKLREIRKDPNVLLPGDKLTIPPIREKNENGETEMRHRFVRRGEPAKLRLKLMLEEDQPRANQPYTLTIDGQQTEGTTDASGMIEVPIPPNAKNGVLVVGPDHTEFKLRLGTVDPISEISGVQDRLNNLGYNVGTPDGELNEPTRAAIKVFQKKHGLEPTGQPDQKTRSKLQEIHGS